MRSVIEARWGCAPYSGARARAGPRRQPQARGLGAPASKDRVPRRLRRRPSAQSSMRGLEPAGPRRKRFGTEFRERGSQGLTRPLPNPLAPSKPSGPGDASPETPSASLDGPPPSAPQCDGPAPREIRASRGCASRRARTSPRKAPADRRGAKCSFELAAAQSNAGAGARRLFSRGRLHTETRSLLGIPATASWRGGRDARVG